MGTLTYSFKEICDKTGYKPSVIRYYEKEFKLNIPRDVNGRRIFTQKEYEKFMIIRQLQTQGYTNTQIKKILDDKSSEIVKEIAATGESSEGCVPVPVLPDKANEEIFKAIDNKLNEINSSINSINQNVNGKERDVLISENLKLKMELKQKAYEIMELKEKIRYDKQGKGNFIKKLFSR